MTTAIVLTVLTLLFLARVAGQALVALLGVTWLPPMEAWFSGYLPYPVLLPIQVLILAVQVTIDWQVWRGAGFFARRRPRASRWLRGFACVYALAMLVRLVVTGGTHVIPIVFHWVLAAYLYTLGRHYARRTGPTPRALRTVAAAVAGTILLGGCAGTRQLAAPDLAERMASVRSIALVPLEVSVYRWGLGDRVAPEFLVFHSEEVRASLTGALIEHFAGDDRFLFTAFQSAPTPREAYDAFRAASIPSGTRAP